MTHFGTFFALLVATAASSQATDDARSWTSDGPDRTITWHPWHQNPQFEYRFRTGDRYLGHEVWEHYLCFGEPGTSAKPVKLFMIHLANKDGFRDVVIGPELPYAILKITNKNMTAHKGVWSWSAQTVSNDHGKTQPFRVAVEQTL